MNRLIANLWKNRQSKSDHYHYDIINESEQIINTDKIYIPEPIANKDYNTYIEEFGSDNVVRIEDVDHEIEKTKLKDLVFIKIDSYRQKTNRDLYNEKHLCLILKHQKLKLPEEKIYNFLKSKFENEDVTTRRSGSIFDKISEFFFIDCIFQEVSDEKLGRKKIELKKDPPNEIDVKFIKCKIEQVYAKKQVKNKANINNYEDKYNYCPYVHCEIGTVIQSHSQSDFLYFENNEIDKLIIRSAKNIILRNVKFKLCHHKNLGEVIVNADNTEIIYDKKILATIGKNEIKGYWNTFHYLLSIKGLSSERSKIEKYIAYFESRDDKWKKPLFKFNWGYTRIGFPFIISCLTLLLNYWITYHQLNIQDGTIIKAAFPINAFKDIILKDFIFKTDFLLKIFILDFSGFSYISGWKWLVLLLELIYTYSFFSFGLAIKKRFGFKIMK